MRKEHKMLVLKDERHTVTHKTFGGKRILKFVKECFKNEWEGGQCTIRKFVIVGLFSHDKKGEITYLVKEKNDTQNFTNVYHINVSWRRLKKRLIADYTHEHYNRFY